MLMLSLVLGFSGVSPISASQNNMVKTGVKCSSKGEVKTSQSKKFTCIKSKGILVWDKGSVISKPSTIVSRVVSDGAECSKMGLQERTTNGLFECRYVVGNKLAFIKLALNLKPISNPASPNPAEFCRLEDKRTTKNFPWPSIAFPAVPGKGFTTEGILKVVVIGIDFPDAVGEGSPTTLWKEDLQKVSEWLNWYTNGKIKYQFVTNDKWLRASKKWSSYLPDMGGKQSGDQKGLSGLTNNEISAEFVAAAENSTDLANANAIWVYEPPSIVSVSNSRNSIQWINRDANIQSSKFGNISTVMVALGPDTFVSKRIRWGYYLHEMLHSHGLFGHSPKIPARTGILSPADGWTNVLLPWDAMTAGWDKPGDVFCVDGEKLTTTDLTLVPLEREQDGVRAGFIKLNDHKGLIIESHRQDKWGQEISPGTAAVMVNLIDTSVNTTWDNPEGWANPSSTGNYLKVDNASHGNHVAVGTPLMAPRGWLGGSSDLWDGIGVINGVGINGDYNNWDLSYFMYPGESITYAGIKISLIKGGDNDTVRIEKIS